jgi:hypothetical protein
MNRIYTLLLVLGLAVMASTSQAESISENKARTIASRFMASHHMPSTNLRMAHKAPALNAPSKGSENASYYVFNNVQASGFVIVAGDDRSPAVLGYSDKGTFDADHLPDELSYLLEGYAAQINALEQGAKAVPQQSLGQAISPLLRAQWDQEAPYNLMLPFINSYHAYTGCVATAMAQVMHYWQWPARPTCTIPAYTTPYYHMYMPELSPVDFEWDKMQDTYLTNDTASEEALAVATLLKYCAQSVEMDFQDYGSGATNITNHALSTYFGYKASAQLLDRENWTAQEWAEIIYNELASNRPVIYGGQKATGGHAFVCDGYDGNGLFHINWGWNGQSNGYFLLNVLDPDIQGTGSASGAYGYINEQIAVVGIEPGEDNSELALTASDVTFSSATTTRSSSNYNFNITVTGRFWNYTSQTVSANIGWGLFDGETLVSTLFNSYTDALRTNRCLYTRNQKLYFGNGITSGTYRIMPIYSERYTSNWRPCIGSDKNYIEVTIDGNECTIQGYGSASSPDYRVDSITCEGLMHHGRPFNIGVTLTNEGDWSNRVLHMFVNGTFAASGYVSLNHGETGVIPFTYFPAVAGDYTLTFSFNENGSSPIATHTLTITQMPEATLTASVEVLNVTDASNMIITSDKFSAIFTITNSGTTTYHEDLSISLYKALDGTYGSFMQAKNQVITLAPGESTVLQVDFDEVFNGWEYFAYAFYYSNGKKINLLGSSYYTIVFPEAPEHETGDVNGDGKVSIKDVTDLINYLLSENEQSIVLGNADVNSDGKISIKDVTDLINLLLSHQ